MICEECGSDNIEMEDDAVVGLILFFCEDCGYCWDMDS